MELNTTVSGKKTNIMAREKRLGLILVFMKGTIKRERNMEKDFSDGQMVTLTMENFQTIMFMVKVSIFGLMDESTMDNGKTTKCKAKVYIHGLMVDSFKEVFTKTRNKVMVYITGLMVANMMVNGSTVNNMEKGPILRQGEKRGVAYGKMERK